MFKIIEKFSRKINLSRIFFDQLFLGFGVIEISENRKNNEN
ncbi:hypothetical protein OA046_01770 [Candidatus Pelagibacter sp.]|nr:hypothetical protein [Candidatus Pelagibacter sp.]